MQAPNGAALSTCNPVIIATGEKHLDEADFQAAGDYGLGLRRTYRSINASGTLFGSHWLSSIDHPRLQFTFQNCHPSSAGDCVPRNVVFSTPDGTRFSYALDTSYDPVKLDPDRADPDSAAQAYVYAVRGAQATGLLIYTYGVGWKLRYNKQEYVYQNGGYLTAIRDVSGAVTTFTRDGVRLTQITSPTGRTLILGYGPNGLVSSVRDPALNYWLYEYDANRMLTKVTAPGAAGQQDIREYTYGGPGNPATADPTLVTGIKINGLPYSSYTYHADGRAHVSALASGEQKDILNYAVNQTSITDARGQITNYNFTDVLGEKKIASISRVASGTCAAASAATAYDANGYIDYTLDWNGNRTDYTFDVAGRLLDTSTAAGTTDVLGTVYTWEGEDIGSIESRGSNGVAFRRVEYTYEGGLVKTETWNDLKTNAQRKLIYDYTFHPSRVLASRTITRVLPEGNVASKTEFDTNGDRIKHTNFLGHSESWSNYNRMGQPGLHTNFRGVAEEFGYHVNGNLTQHALVLPAGRRFTRYAYNHNRQVTDITYASGRIDRYRYNASGRMDKTGDAAGNFATTDFNVAANTVTWSADRHLPVLASGNIPVASPQGKFSQTTIYDSLGRPYTVKGNNGQQTDFRYDSNGNLASQTDALGRATTFEYDAQNRPVRRTAPDGGVSRWEYDNEGRLQYFHDPRNVRTGYTYTGFGDVATVSSPDGGNVVYGFDTAGRLKSETREGAAIVYVLDALDRLRQRSRSGVVETYTYDVMGNIEATSDNTGSTRMVYNAAEELESKVTTIGQVSYTVLWAYDLAGRTTGMGYDNQQLSLGFTYNAYGQLSRISTSKPGTWATLANQFLYQPATGQRYAWRFSNSIPRLTALDTDGRVSSIFSLNAVNQEYEYHVSDTLSKIKDNVYPALNHAPSYNAVDRVANNGAVGDAQAFFWDLAGNRLNHQRGAVAYTDTIAPASNRLLAWQSANASQWRNFEYDAQGNLFRETGNRGTRTYEYDAFFRLSGVKAGASVLAYFGNNAFNQRAAKNTYAAGAIHYVYGKDGELLAEYNNGVRTYYIWLDGELLAIERGGAIYASYNDRTGRPVTLLDAAAQRVWRASNFVFDRRVESSTIGDMNIGFPGQYYDGETGLWYNWHRYYDPALGRYIQADPIGLDGGANSYAYAAGNAISIFDPDGLAPITYQHHWVPQSIYNTAGIPADARAVFDKGVTNPLTLHQYDKPHREYMEGAKDLWKKLVPDEKAAAAMTPAQASEILSKFRGCPDPRMKALQRQIWNRAMFDSLRRIPVRGSD